MSALVMIALAHAPRGARLGAPVQDPTFKVAFATNCPSPAVYSAYPISSPDFPGGSCKLSGRWDCVDTQPFTCTAVRIQPYMAMNDKCCTMQHSPPSPPPPRWLPPSAACQGDGYVFAQSGEAARNTFVPCSPWTVRSGPCGGVKDSYCYKPLESSTYEYVCLCAPGYQAYGQACYRCPGYTPSWCLAPRNGASAEEAPGPSTAKDASAAPPECHRADERSCRRKQQACATDAAVRAACPHACGLCPSAAPSSSPSGAAMLDADASGWHGPPLHAREQQAAGAIALLLVGVALGAVLGRRSVRANGGDGAML
jgi:hypothetical protein